jgi:hypothetical protein
MLLKIFLITVGCTKSSALIRRLGFEVTYLIPLVTDALCELRTADALMLAGTLLLPGPQLACRSRGMMIQSTRLTIGLLDVLHAPGFA